MYNFCLEETQHHTFLMLAKGIIYEWSSSASDCFNSLVEPSELVK
jgi:hypothetical protein